jgi:peptide/nickel transport system substrate-binding protein
LAGTNAPGDVLVDATALDKYTLQLKVPPAVQGLHLFLDGERVEMLAPEITAKYGNQSNWRNFATVGPFMLTDYVTGSALTFKKNPNYYLTDPVGPGKGQQLPYVDGVKMLIIPDLSTMQAGFRTGKIDQMLNVSWEDWGNFVKSNPKIQYKQDYGLVSLPAGREDKNLPFNDLRVRQALNLAIDKKAIVDGYYQGHAEILGWPFYKNAKAHTPFYTPLEQMPQSTQDLFTYNPTKAKQLLADAGYPNGFQTNIVCSSSGTSVDVLSIVREQLLKVGVDMTIKPLEQGVFNSMNRGRAQDQMLFKETKMYFVPWKMHEVRKESLDNLSFWDSPQTRAVYDTVNANLFKDDAKWEKALKDVVPFILEQSPYIWMPVPYTYDIWQPWMKNYYGAHDIGYFCPERFARFIWIDQDLKKSMGY